MLILCSVFVAPPLNTHSLAYERLIGKKQAEEGWRKERRTGKTKEGKEKLNLGGWWVRGNSNLKRQAKQIAEKRKNVLSTVDRFRWRCVQSVPNSTKRSAPTRANDFSSLHEGPRRSDAKSLKQKRQPSDERKHVEERRQGRPLAQWQ